MDHELSVKLTQLCRRDKKIVRFCQKEGTLEKYSDVLCALNPTRPPVDVQSSFCKFMCEKEYFRVAESVLLKYVRRFGKGLDFYRAFGIVMLMQNRKVIHFVAQRELNQELVTTASDSRLQLPVVGQRVNVTPNSTPILRRPQLPAYRNIAGADVPSGATLFIAGLQSQLPSRGRPTANGYLRRKNP